MRVVEVKGVATPAIIEYCVNLGLGLIGVCALAIRNARTYETLQRTLSNLQQTLSEVKTLRGVIPICASCKRIRDDVGAWSQVEAYQPLILTDESITPSDSETWIRRPACLFFRL